MKNILLVAVALLFRPVAVAQKAMALPMLPTETRELPSYQSIEALNGIKISLSAPSSTTKAGVYVEASSADLLKKIKTVVEGQKLKVFLTPDGDANWQGVKLPEQYKVRIVAADLRALRVAKGAVVTFEKVFYAAGPQAFAIDLFSGGKVMGDVHMQALDVTLRGGTEAVMGGTASRISVRAVEGSTFLSSRLKADECVAYAASASRIQLAVAKTLDAQSVNEAEIRYIGSPSCKNAYCKDGGKISKIFRL